MPTTLLKPNSAGCPRIAFVGAVEGSLTAFNALVAAGMAPVLLVTLPPEVSHRHSDFADLGLPARAAGTAVHLTTDINAPATIAALAEAAPDLTLVVGWSQICRRAFRSVAPLGTLGFHPAPLPRYRGRAVIPWTILSGEATTGSTFFWLDDGVDSGPIVMQQLFPIDPDETARSLYDRHVMALAEMTPRVVARIAAGNAGGTPQDEARASYCAKRTMEDGVIDWGEPADAILRLVRAVGDPYPGAFTFAGDTRIVVEAARSHRPKGRHIGFAGQVQTYTSTGFTVLCGDGETVEITRWQPSDGRRPRIHARLNCASSGEDSMRRSSVYQRTKCSTPSATLVAGR
ncbi:methionyl-tRNA formyltransferase [Aureimonas sp. SA4125]|uniref:methionyl-tRNA formyltransferase n=1 Tax=Aureimonas sp. SA4125 TaxID=2826993 RepID=UPI001CC69349|nr:formyltransferase family protein [Aureimonas sp. SA4125]BDA82940.1 methionyl-tRNA formyltransferase [Aureimonas sp. SA4125]